MSSPRIGGVTCAVLLGCLAVGAATAQVYSPKTLAKDQIDASDVRTLAQGIISQARAMTPRDKAEAIWRFFLPDGRFVRPGFWYHIAGWAYEEPKGEVLDAVKLLNSYGFGLCYHIAPLLQAVYHAAGFEDARVWFLNGHTVAEVFYEGGYHYFDSDLMGYNPIGKGPIKELPVASVQDIASHPEIILGRLQQGPWDANTPWYPGDVAAGAIPIIVDLFTTKKDNWLFPFPRYSQGHTMEFVLRPGERMIRYYGSEEGLFYLPYRQDEQGWHEVPVDDPANKVWSKNGPRSYRDTRDWATGRLEYQPVLHDRKAYFSVADVKLPVRGEQPAALTVERGRGSVVFEVRSPYVLLAAEYSMTLDLEEGATVGLETSVDNGLSWDEAGLRKGPYRGEWSTTPRILAQTSHGSLNVVSGKYAYLLRLNLSASGRGRAAARDIRLLSRFQFNMRTLSPLRKGRNDFVYTPGAPQERFEFPIRLDQVAKTAVRVSGVRHVREDGQHLLVAENGQQAEIVFEISAPDGAPLSGVDAGARFLDLRNVGLAPDKRTAETRPTEIRLPESGQAAVIEWALSPDGPFRPVWTYDPELRWRDGKPVPQVLRWPEVDHAVRGLPPGTAKVCVRFRLRNMALDDVRFAAVVPRAKTGSSFEIVHVWFEDGKERSHVEKIANPMEARSYSVSAGGKNLKNYGLIYSVPADR